METFSRLSSSPVAQPLQGNKSQPTGFGIEMQLCNGEPDEKGVVDTRYLLVARLRHIPSPIPPPLASLFYHAATFSRSVVPDRHTNPHTPWDMYPSNP